MHPQKQKDRRRRFALDDLPCSALGAAGMIVAPLHLATTYRRRVNASLERIWENVFDWEHLAHLHEESFAACALIDAGRWGWRVRLTVQGTDTQLIEMRADRATGQYTSTTIEGTGAGTQIRVSLVPLDADVVDVTVEFHIPESRPERLAAIGAAYVEAYARLWDEDEAMMRTRQRALAKRRTPDLSAPSLDLGEEQTVRTSVPRAFDFGGISFRLVEINGTLIAHSRVCPHWLGPLGDAPVSSVEVRCPWHGYRFNIVTGACAGHPSLKLAPAPEISLIEGRVVAAWPMGADA